MAAAEDPRRGPGQIDALLEHYTDAETVAILNQRGLHTGAGKPFTMSSLRWCNMPAAPEAAGSICGRPAC